VVLTLEMIMKSVKIEVELDDIEPVGRAGGIDLSRVEEAA